MPISRSRLLGTMDDLPKTGREEMKKLKKAV